MKHSLKLVFTLVLGSLSLVDAGRAQESQPTVYRFLGNTAFVSGGTRNACVTSSLGLSAYSDVRRSGPVGETYTESQRMVSIRYTIIDFCEKYRIEMSADIIDPNMQLSSLQSATVSTTATVPMRKCTFAGPIVCQSLRVPLTLQAQIVGDSELSTQMRSRSTSRIGTELITAQHRNHTVAAEAQFSLQIGDHTATADALSGWLMFERSGSLTVSQLPRDPA